MTSELEDLEAKFLRACSASSDGLSNAQALQAVPGLTTQKLVAMVNSLSRTGQIEFIRKGSQLLYRQKSISQCFVSSDVNEKLVFQNLEQAGTKGFYPIDIKQRTGLSMTAVTKVLRSLETKGVIKSYLSVQGRDASGKKKVFLLAGVTPDKSITGGNLYENNDIESEYVTVLLQQIYRFLYQKVCLFFF